MTLDSLQEFRVSTSNYGADAGRSSGAQVSLVTKSGTNDYHGAGNWVQRNTRFSSNDYFLKLSQLQAGEAEQGAQARQEHLRRLARRARPEGQAVLLRQLRAPDGEDSETPVLRNIPSMSMRDGVLIYPCADPGAVSRRRRCRAFGARTPCRPATTA